jgi:hypothetical protein
LGIQGEVMSVTKQSLVWNGEGIEVHIIDHPPFLDIKVQYEEREFKLLVKYGVEIPYIHFEDILGNGFGSGYQCSGVGSLMVNTALLYFTQMLPADTEVTGQMSDVGDPSDPEELNKCRQIRHDFWRSFGFNVLSGEWGFQRIESILGSLSPKSSGLVFDKYPRLIPIEEFS